MARCIFNGCIEDRTGVLYCQFHKCSKPRCEALRLPDSFFCNTCDKNYIDNYDPVPLGASLHHKQMSRFYGHLLGPKLKDVFEEKLRAPIEEQQQVVEELAMMRVIAGDAVKMYDAVVSKECDEKFTEKQKEALLLATGAVVRNCMEDVSKIAKVSADIQQKNTGEITILSLRATVHQLLDMMRSVCGHEFHFIAERFERLVDEQLQLPKKLGTNKTPDIDVEAQVTLMDDAIPQV